MNIKDKHFWYAFCIVAAFGFFSDPLSCLLNRQALILILDVLLFTIVFSVLCTYPIKVTINEDNKKLIYFVFAVFLFSICMIGVAFGESTIMNKIRGYPSIVNHKLMLLIMSGVLLSLMFKVHENLSIIDKSLKYILVACMIYIVIEFVMIEYFNGIPNFIYALKAYRKDISFVSAHKYPINGPIFGAQTASILSALSFFYFYYSYRGLMKLIMVGLSLICLHLTFTVTAFICIFISLCAMMITHKKGVLIFILIIPLVCIFFTLIGDFVLYMKLGKSIGMDVFTFFDYYVFVGMTQFSDTLHTMWKLPFGTLEHKVHTPNFADVAVFNFVIRYGYIFSFVFFMTCFYSIIELIKCARKSNDDVIRRLVAYIVILLTSSIHYDNLLNTGLFHFFIVFISVGLSRNLIHPFQLSRIPIHR